MISSNEYNVVVESVGNANPAVCKLLSESLNLPIDLVSRTIYNAPAVLFYKVDEKIAENANSLLTQLGLQVSINDALDPIPQNAEPVEVAVYVNDINKLPIVCQQLSAFLGCKHKEALTLLMNDFGIVLGNISIATAQALSNRLDAEVVISNPKLDFFTLQILSTNHLFLNQLNEQLKKLNINQVVTTTSEIKDIAYDIAQQIWTRFQSTGYIKLVNQSFQRFEILLNTVDTTNANHKAILINEVGMPDDIIDEVLTNLPIVLHESVNTALLTEMLDNYKQAGLNCSYHAISNVSSMLSVQHISNFEKAKQILSEYYDTQTLTKNTTEWIAPTAINNLIARYALAQLETIGCEANITTQTL
jgi:hypothetical protein